MSSQRDSLGATSVLETAGDLGRDLLAVDWASARIGRPGLWPQSLTTVLGTMLGSRFAMWMAWGPDLTFFCNDAYRRDTLGLKYPWALGKPAREVWSEIWDDIGPRIESVLGTGTSTWDEALMLFLERSGYREETYHTFSYSPLADDRGAIVGMLCVVAEETERVIGERRMSTLNRLASSLSGAHHEPDVLAAVSEALGANGRDLPFTLTYLIEGEEARLACTTGVAEGDTAAPPVLSLKGESTRAVWPAWRLRDESTVVLDLAGDDGLVSPVSGDWGVPVKNAMMVTLPAQGRNEPAGFLVAGLNPHRAVDSAATAFVELIAGQIASAISGARAYEAERSRAEKLSELDRAKTAFFTNISHEFRTPLTLMLGPLDDALSEVGAGRLGGSQEERVRLARRNGDRLLTLVNMLLDFNRLQAGRVEPQLEPVDLASETQDLASMFRSAVEAGGLELVVDTPSLEHPVAVDRGMWEQIVTNLVSNAFKHTFKGKIEVRLRAVDDSVELTVRDSGEGIPELEVPLVFDRFHRVKGARARSGEGSGIGLALVRELVEVQGGSITLESRLGEGTTACVVLPAKRSHLEPSSSSGSKRGSPDQAAWSAAPTRVAEAESWLVGDIEGEPGGEERDDDVAYGGSRILVVDDNADMRSYLVRLLEGRFEVRAVGGGAEALASIGEERPDLILTDVMMPDMSGLELLRLVREDPELAELPIVLLSARAGPEAAVEGLDLGADDYLAKPFSAEDLFARVNARLAAGKERRKRRALAGLAAALGRATHVQEVIGAVQSSLEPGARRGQYDSGARRRG